MCVAESGLMAALYLAANAPKRKPVPPLGRNGFFGVRGKRREMEAYNLALSSLPTTNLTVLDALILIFSPVLGFTPMRALRWATLKVPKPINCTVFSFFRPDLMPSI